jgi:hypothetical protein
MGDDAVQEVVGTFFDVDHLKAAVADLVDAGFDDAQIGLLASEHAVERSLGDFYARASHADHTPDSPSVAFVTKNHEDDTFHGLLGGLFFCGASTVAGAAVVSAAVIGGGVLLALSGVAAVGVAGAAAGLAIHKTDSDRLKEQVDEGHLLLFVRTPDAEQAKRAVEILSRHDAHDAAVYRVEAPDENG